MLDVNRWERTKWFRHDRFGMFIHWGLYAIPARGEWVRNQERISIEEYQKYFDAFDPVDYDPKKWAKLAKKAGMKYAVMTAKHHDGFCLFDSAFTDYKSTNTKAKRDLIKEYIEAFREEGIKVGIYYSLIDWHHEAYPAYQDKYHPMRDNEEYRGRKKDFSAYVSYLHAQVRELLTNYGTIDIMWFDFSYDDMSDEKWEAKKLVEMIRSLCPDIIIDNRLCVHGKNVTEEITGDFYSPEQCIPDEGMTDARNTPVPWEACITLNNHWGYAREDHNFKSPSSVIQMLVECVSKGGNLLLNVGPDARGNIPEKCVKILDTVGEWMQKNSESIYGCAAAGLGRQDWGRFTKNKNKLYVHIFQRGIGDIEIKNFDAKVKSARLLSDYSEISMKKPWTSKYQGEDSMFLQLTDSSILPNEMDTVVELELDESI